MRVYDKFAIGLRVHTTQQPKIDQNKAKILHIRGLHMTNFSI